MSLKLHREEIAQHNSVDDAWVIVDGAVYDVTSFLASHPGGLSITEEYLGTDVSRVIRSDEVHSHSSTAFEILEQYKIGVINNEQVSLYNYIHACDHVHFCIIWFTNSVHCNGNMADMACKSRV